jgi:hypothetical protein
VCHLRSPILFEVESLEIAATRQAPAGTFVATWLELESAVVWGRFTNRFIDKRSHKLEKKANQTEATLFKVVPQALPRKANHNEGTASPFDKQIPSPVQS